MLRVSLLATAGLLAVNGKSDTARRLQEEQLLRRRNVWDDIENTFESIGDSLASLDDVFVDVWADVDQFFTEDMVNWFENDFVDFMNDFAHFWEVEAWEAETWETFAEITADEFMKGWDSMVDGLDAAWDWTKDTSVTVWSDVEDFFVKLDCMVDGWTGQSCTKCVKDACNDTLDQDTIKSIDSANEVALMDINDEFEPLINGCASAMEQCPGVSDCQELYALPASTKAFVADSIARCNMCYSCVVYGSTNEGCQKALDDIMPNNCEGCSVNQQNMYKMMYSCSSIEAIVEGIDKLAESYAPGGDAHDALDSMCKYCKNCSGYKTELQKTCTDWATIKAQWDYQAPVVPDVLCLNPEGCPAPKEEVNAVAPTSVEPVVTPEPTESPTPAPTQSPTPAPTQSPTQSPTTMTTGGRPCRNPRECGRPGRGGNPRGRRLRL